MKQGFMRQIYSLIKESDLIIELVDARFPEITRNVEIEEKIISSRKKLLIVINKVDLISKNRAETIKKELIKNSKYKVIFASAKKKTGINLIRKEIGILKKDKNEFIVGMLGYPNSGKSTLINSLSGKGGARVRTSKRAGFTRGLQRIKIGEGAYLIDAPGIIPYGLRDEFDLFLVGAKNANQVKDVETICIKLIGKFMDEFKEKFEVNGDEDEILEAIGKKQRFFVSGGNSDTTKTARFILEKYERSELF